MIGCLRLRTLLTFCAASLLSSIASAQTVPYSTPMRDVESHDRNPYLEQRFFQIQTGYEDGSFTVPVPAGKRLFIEQIQVWCDTSPANPKLPNLLFWTYRSLGTTASVMYPLSPLVARNTEGTTFESLSHITIVADAGAGAEPGLAMHRQSIAGSWVCRATVFGHTVPL